MPLMKFNFQVVYVPGRDLQGADAMSRRQQSPVSVDGILNVFIKAVEEDVEEIRNALLVLRGG